VNCPRCSVGEISDQTHECTLCGFAPSNVITLATPFPRELEDHARQELEHQFQIEGVLGRSRRSVVYLAQERAHDRLVALKIIPRTPTMAPELATAFQREAALAATLEHPHIVPVYRSGVTRVLLWYTMEYCNSRSLAETLRSSQQMDVAGCLRVIHQVASALDYAHRRGIAHGGLTPSNVLIDTRGWVRVGDFGIARAFGRPVADQPDAPELRYLAPEHFAPHNLAGPSADQYALAVLAYDCLVGLAPSPTPKSDAEGEPGSAATQTELAPHLFEALRRATTDQPSGRFATVLDFVEALERTASALTLTSAQPIPRATPVPRRSPGPPLLLMDEDPPGLPPFLHRYSGRVFGGVAFALIAGALLWWFWPRIVGAPAVDSAEIAPFPPLAATPAESLFIDSSPPAALVKPQPLPTSPRPAPPPARVSAAGPYPVVTAPPPRRVRPPGKLFINAMPWAELYIDGKLVGNTPRANLDIPAGTHRLRLMRDGFRSYEMTITVAPGATVRLTDIVLQGITP